ncbi:MAG: hypothetical protein KHZ62_06800 [Clostridiales bacterium]|nr:hypothetical protein [Clostridiales bacterium]
MKLGMIIFFCTGICFMAGCNKSTGPAPVMPQNALSPVTDYDVSSENTESHTSVVSEEPWAQTNSENSTDYSLMTQEELLQSYYTIKAEEKALEIEEEQLKINFRIGSVGNTEFEQQKLYFSQQENILDLEEDTIENYLKQLNFTGNELIPQEIKELFHSENRQQIYELYENLELEEDSLDLEEDTLETQYLSNKMTREEFIAKQSDLEKRDFMLECQLDYLETLGYDD